MSESEPTPHQLSKTIAGSPEQKLLITRVYGKYWSHLPLFHNIFGIQEPSGGQNHWKMSLGKAKLDFWLKILSDLWLP